MEKSPLGPLLQKKGERLWIVGASVRAAAASAVRSGLPVSAADLFSDQDLSTLVGQHRVEQIDSWPALLSSPALGEQGPWMYGGGLENRPVLVDLLARRRPLWGTGADALRSVRDPAQLQRALRRAGLAFPEFVRPDGAAPPVGWLRKPLRSAGGRGVRFTRPSDAGQRLRQAYFQEFIHGSSYSAAYLAGGGASRLLGISRQVLARELPVKPGSRPPCQPFQYIGSYIGPWSTDPREPWWQAWQELGHQLARSFQLVGLFGVDAVVPFNERRRVVPIEVNPRYTASMELYERGGILAVVAAHCSLCLEGQLPELPPARLQKWLGKRILYAESDVRVTPELLRELAGDADELADVPRLHQIISRGQPLATQIVAAETEQGLRCRLGFDVAAAT